MRGDRPIRTMSGTPDPLREVDSLVARRDFEGAAALLDGAGRGFARAGETAKAIAALKRLARLRPDARESERAVVDAIREHDREAAGADGALPSGLARSPLFSDLTREELVDLIRGLRHATAEPGELIVSEGEPGDSLWVLASGEARVFVQGFDRRNREVRRLVSGDFFGEISLLTGAPRSASVIASTACDLLELDRGTVSAIAERHAGVRATIRRFCLERSESVEERSARSGDGALPFEPLPLEEEEPGVEIALSGASRFSAADLATLAPHCGVRTFGAGETIFRRGDAGDRMFAIEAGEVELRFEQDRNPKRLGPGETFGELALVTARQRRTATALAASDARLLVLDRAAWERLRAERPGPLLALLERTCGYLVDSEQRLVADLRRRNRELERALDFLQRTREELTTIEARALTDDLTGLYNRRCFDEQLRKGVERAHAGGMVLALLLVDVDRFKQVNDTFGHMVGDVVLRRLAQLLRGSVRWTDLPCRIGGDEFAVLWSDLDRRSAERRARSLAPALTAFEIAGAPRDLRVTASLGGALLEPGESPQQLFARADRGLYRAKEAGRGRLAWDERVDESPDGSEPR